MEAFEFTTPESIAVESAKDKSDNYRMAPLCPYSLSPSLVQSMPPYLESLYDDVVKLQGMIRAGQLMNAWIGMPCLVRKAELARCTYFHSIGGDDVLTLPVDQNQPFNTPPPDTQEIESRRHVWWSILQLDSQISMHIGRPLAAQVGLGVDQPALIGVEGIYRELEQSKLDFTQYALEVLDELCIYGDPTGDRTYESLVELAKLDRLLRMEMRIPQIPKDLEYDEQLMVATCDYTIELLSLKMMLCCTLATAALKKRGSFSVFEKDSQREQKKRVAHRDEAYPHQNAILKAARAILESFFKVAAMDNHDQYANWNRFFDAFCAAAILAIAYLRRETKLMSDVSTIMTMSSHLQAILSRNPHCRLATVAAGRIGQLLDDIEKDVALSMEKSKTGNTEASSTSGTKRRKRDRVSPKQENPYGEVPGTSMIYAQSSQDMGTEGALQVHDSAGYVRFADNPESTTTSFDTSISVAHYPPYGPYSDQIAMNNATGTSWYWLHPPVAQPQPPFRNFDEWPVPAYTMNGDWQHLTVSHYQSNIVPEQAAHVDGSHDPGPFYDRSSISISVPATPLQQQPSGTNPYYAHPQPSLSEAQLAAGTAQGDYIAQIAAQGENPGDWVQHQQSLMRRNSAMAAQSTGATNEAMYHSQPEHFQAYDIPTTTGAWG